uniref:Ig-like domain-containing protein n=1 Tax=Ornithorhynchus anatinus TaxID=9258 RepID=A0A6I8NXK4_ORNAN
MVGKISLSSEPGLKVSEEDMVSLIQLVESGPGVVKPSESLRLSCQVSGESITTGKIWNWIRQDPGKVSSTWNAYYASSLQNRITIAAEPSKNEFSLQLNRVTPADTAVYYCARCTVRGNQCEPRHKPSPEDGQEEAGQQAALGTH